MVIVKNTNFTLCLSLTMLRLTGFWPPDDFEGWKLALFYSYGFAWFIFTLGVFIFTEIGDIVLVWGNLPLMTATSFLLLTNIAHSLKFVSLVTKRKAILKMINDSDISLRTERSTEGQNIVRSVKILMKILNGGNKSSSYYVRCLLVKKCNPKAFSLVRRCLLLKKHSKHFTSCDRGTCRQLFIYMLLTCISLIGFASSAEKNKLPFRAWYPFDTRSSPVYELTYAHQVIAIWLAALLNVSKDTLVTTLISQCRCRIRLVSLSLRNMHNFQDIKNNSFYLKSSCKFFTSEQEKILERHLKSCVIEHQQVLDTVVLLQNTFTVPTFIQFNVSRLIICVSAFQLINQTDNYLRFISLGFYLTNMLFQVFTYCYQGEQLSSESEKVAGAAYSIPWYTCSVRLRRSILIVMLRCRRIAKITIGNFTVLRLDTFTSILKTSYSLFTLLKQMTE